MGELNTDVTNRGIEFDNLDDFLDLFNWTNLITSPTCFTKAHKSTIDWILTKKESTIDLILTNKESCFQKNKVTQTGLSDFHKLISLFLGRQFCWLKPKNITIEILKNWMRKISSKKLKIQTSYSIQMTQMKTKN